MVKQKGRRLIAAELVCLLMMLSGCSNTDVPPAAYSSHSEAAVLSSSAASSGAESIVSSGLDGDTESAVQIPPSPPATSNVDEPSDNPYLNQLIADTIAKFATPEMTEYEKAKAAFDYMITSTVLDEPIGLDLWRIHEGSEMPLSFVENRSVSVLQYGVGMCEDYAAAFTMLLRGLGLEAEYLPGLTYSLEGQLVDHAWVVAKVDGVWYHLDCQLEDNISRHGAIRYRYFMKSDATMAGSHRWGQNLIDAAILFPEQNAEIEAQFLYLPCPQDNSSPARQTFEEAPAPDIPALTADAAEQIAAYEHENGALPPLALNIIPPVFGLEGYGPPDQG